MIDFDEIDWNAVGIAGLLTAALYWGLFVNDGMEVIPLSYRIIALFISAVGGYVLGAKLLDR